MIRAPLLLNSLAGILLLALGPTSGQLLILSQPELLPGAFRGELKRKPPVDNTRHSDPRSITGIAVAALPLRDRCEHG